VRGDGESIRAGTNHSDFCMSHSFNLRDQADLKQCDKPKLRAGRWQKEMTSRGWRSPKVTKNASGVTVVLPHCYSRFGELDG
jgi:hypothetical protein